ncbi:MAG: NADH-quinone oxidoreductase subunit L, partial [Sulfurovum sp.]
MENLVYIALFAPLVSSLFAAMFAMTPRKTFVGIIASLLLFTGFVASATLAVNIFTTGEAVSVTMMQWIGMGDLYIPFGFVADQVSVTMMTMVSLIST